MKARDQAQDFLKQRALYRLGALPTEMPHPLTKKLSTLAQNDLKTAIETLRKVDLQALEALKPHLNELQLLQQDIQDTWSKKNKVILCGCGATGRLAITLESLWRQVNKTPQQKTSLLSFMAGGDYAFVRSVENFEDFPEFGVKQLLDIGYNPGDLLISITEGGETPFVIGATEHAAQQAGPSPWFLYCNPDDVLVQNVERSRKIITDSHIKKLSIPIGPMALAGSTRLQACTVLMFAVGMSLFPNSSFDDTLQGFITYYQNLNLDFMQPLVEFESDIYKNNQSICYSVTPITALPCLTDIAERHPTFHMPALPHLDEKDTSTPSPCTLNLTSSKNSLDAWKAFLHRNPRTVEWDEYQEKISFKKLLGYDFSQPSSSTHTLQISTQTDKISLKWQTQQYVIQTPLSPLLQQILLKILLNMLSTLVMGRIGRYQSNLMLWVKPTNGKLVDRAVRFIHHLWNEEDLPDISDKTVVLNLFEAFEETQANESVILKTIARLKNKMGIAVP